MLANIPVYFCLWFRDRKTKDALTLSLHGLSEAAGRRGDQGCDVAAPAEASCSEQHSELTEEEK